MNNNKVEKFYFGASSSAHQAEGGQRNDWSEWEIRTATGKAHNARNRPPTGGWPAYILERHPNPLEETNYVAGRAADHWHRYEEDFDLAKELGHTAHRFSIEWSRVEPEEGRFDERALAHYRDVVRALRARGMEPFVTLWHWPLPLWLARKGGWESSAAIGAFAKYAGRVAAYLKDDVKFWIPLNEPEIYANMSYLNGTWPPQVKNPLRMLRVLSHLIRAHRAAHPVLKGINPSCRVGIAKNNIHFEAAGRNQWNELLKAVADWWWNRLPLDLTNDTLDFIGLNFYFHNRIDGWFNRNRNERINDIGWELAPESLFHALMDLKRYEKPVYVTENGLADARDLHRAEYIHEALRAVKRAVGNGVDVRGYFHWALTDNFEWADGFWPRFGLVEVDYQTLTRRPRASAQAYKNLIERWPNI
ncbi:MAG: glycoside hydrolase family 1 protein [Candidatus Brennerbacteria bacterium]|nr:glycoside hydrolase family 1 protein [Candidatus Brennerbacteria bacterium]